VRTSAVSSRLRMAARCVVLAVGLVLVISANVGPAPRARADARVSLVGLTNNARAANGLPALVISGDLAAVAAKQAAWMAAHHVLAHTPNLPEAICCWSAVGENVGEGSSPSVLQAAFMASPPHRANILSPIYTQIGVGVAVDADGQLWVSVIFRAPSGAVPKPTPKPTPTPTHGAAPTSHPTPTPTRAAVGTRSVSRPAAVPSPTSTAVVVQAQADRASRSLPDGRLPLAAAERFARAIATSALPAGPDPVSSLLEFAAVTADSSN
jgi:Cysteine-rich secretory protein family